MLRGALLGVGHVAVNGHLPGWRNREDATLVAAADARPDGHAAFRDAFPGSRWYDSAEELLATEDLDFADICTPPSSHAALCRAALERSIHVLCEKPLVLSPLELRGLPALASERECTLFTVHNWKHAPAIAKVTELLRGGAIGEIRHCRWETLRDRPAAAEGEEGNWRVGPPESGGGVLVDHGWHALYLVPSWLSGTPRLVAARLETKKHVEWPVEDTAMLTLVYPSASAEIYLTWAASTRANRAELSGTKGKIFVEGGQVAVFPLDGSTPTGEWTFPSLAEGSHHPDWFGGVVQDFLAEIAEPGRRGRNLAEAALCANILALGRESNARGGIPLAAERIAVPSTRP
jgi:predicted dehydrogenase